MRARRGRLKTVIGIVLIVLMLFPLYWMINVSLTPTADLRKNPPNLFPVPALFEGYAPSCTTSCRSSAQAWG